MLVGLVKNLLSLSIRTVTLCHVRGHRLKSGRARVQDECEPFGWYEEVQRWEAVVLVGLVRRQHSLSIMSTLFAFQRASLSRLVWGWVER